MTNVFRKARTCNDGKKIKRMLMRSYVSRWGKCMKLGYEGYLPPRCYKGKKDKGTCYSYSKDSRKMRVKPNDLDYERVRRVIRFPPPPRKKKQ